MKKIVIITPDKDHSHVATYHLNSYLLETIKTFIPNIEKVLFWSNGCVSQFKSCYVFQDTAHLDSSITIDWNYFESHHGKGAVDGIGGCIKQKVFKYVKSLKVILSNTEQFANNANKVVVGVNVIYHDTTKLQYLLNKDEAITLTGTREVRILNELLKTIQ